MEQEGERQQRAHRVGASSPTLAAGRIAWRRREDQSGQPEEGWHEDRQRHQSRPRPGGRRGSANQARSSRATEATGTRLRRRLSGIFHRFIGSSGLGARPPPGRHGGQYPVGYLPVTRVSTDAPWSRRRRICPGTRPAARCRWPGPARAWAPSIRSWLSSASSGKRLSSTSMEHLHIVDRLAVVAGLPGEILVDVGDRVGVGIDARRIGEEAARSGWRWRWAGWY